MTIIVTILYGLALLCFSLAAAGIPLGRVNAMALGLLFWLLADQLPGWVHG